MQVAQANLAKARKAKANASDTPATEFDARHSRGTQSNMLPRTPLGSSKDLIIASPEHNTTDDLAGIGQYDGAGGKSKT